VPCNFNLILIALFNVNFKLLAQFYLFILAGSPYNRRTGSSEGLNVIDRRRLRSRDRRRSRTPERRRTRDTNLRRTSPTGILGTLYNNLN
jgi:hypothetical protein